MTAHLFTPDRGHRRCGACGREELNHVHFGISDEERERIDNAILIDLVEHTMGLKP